MSKSDRKKLDIIPAYHRASPQLTTQTTAKEANAQGMGGVSEPDLVVRLVNVNQSVLRELNVGHQLAVSLTIRPLEVTTESRLVRVGQIPERLTEAVCRRGNSSPRVVRVDAARSICEVAF